MKRFWNAIFVAYLKRFRYCVGMNNRMSNEAVVKAVWSWIEDAKVGANSAQACWKSAHPLDVEGSKLYLECQAGIIAANAKRLLNYAKAV